MSLFSNLESDRLITAVAVTDVRRELSDGDAAIDVSLALQSAVSIRTGQPIVNDLRVVAPRDRLRFHLRLRLRAKIKAGLASFQVRFPCVSATLIAARLGSARRVLMGTGSCEWPGAADWSFASSDRNSCGSTFARASLSKSPRARHHRDARQGGCAWSLARPCGRSRLRRAWTYRRRDHGVASWDASALADWLHAVARLGTPVPWLPWA